MLRVKVEGLSKADRAVRQFAAQLSDLRSFWSQLGEHLADEAQRRWPLRRRSGRLRTSLTWAGGRLGLGGVYEPTATRLTFGTDLFYGRFSQYGTKRQRQRTLIHVNAADANTRLSEWTKSRALSAGLEVE